MTAVLSQSTDLPVVHAQRMLGRLDSLTIELVEAIRTGDHDYAESTLLTRDELSTVVRDNLSSMLRQLSSKQRPDFAAPAAAGALKAAHGVPLAALLHAYRLCGRLIWAHLLEEVGRESPEALPHLASEVWRIIDEYSSAAAQAYGQHVADRTRRDDEQRRAMLRSLLVGGGAAESMWEITRALLLPRSGTFVVVSAEISGKDDASGELRKHLRGNDISALWLTELDAQIGLLSFATPRVRDQLPELLRAVAGGRIGVSRTFTTPTDAAAALHEAELACRCSDPGTASVNDYGDSAIGLLLNRSPHAGQELAQHVLGPILELSDHTERDTLLHTLATWFDCGGSSTRVASRLHYHRNTVHHRLRRVQELTGRSCTDPVQASELYIAVRATALLTRSD
ncbi:PucR family transcriptional regulator [Nocardia callitridis]|uniref:Helix-turn-helix domain-containing protein n=1 Tax=Nocardia callitridis TaxID=648753 RepID=A0ABP9KDJ5_9NOCA